MSRRNVGFVVAEIVVAFGATLAGVLLAFSIERWDRTSREEDVFELKRQVATDECRAVAQSLDELSVAWETRAADFADNPEGNLDMVSLIDLPIILLERFDRDFDFVSRLRPETYRFLLSQTRNVAGGVGALNVSADRIDNLLFFSPAEPTDHTFQQMQIAITKEAQTFPELLPTVSSDVFFTCYTLLADKCSSSPYQREFARYHAAWAEGKDFEIASDHDPSNCASVWGAVKY